VKLDNKKDARPGFIADSRIIKFVGLIYGIARRGGAATRRDGGTRQSRGASG